MQISLRSALMLTGICAVLTAAWSRAPVLAVFMASILPPVAYAAYRKRVRKTYARFVLLFAALLPLYLASYGPTFLLNAYVLYTRPPATKKEIDRYNRWVQIQATVFAPMNLCRASGTTFSLWRHEYLSGWMDLSDDTMEYLLGSEDNGAET